MDNVSNNKTCMKELKILLHTHDVEFDALDHLVMCFPHIIHICMTHVLRSSTDADLTAVANAWIGAFPDKEVREAYAEAVRSDPMKKCCDLIQNIHASGFCCDKFIDTIRTSNVKNWFKSDDGELVQVPELAVMRTYTYPSQFRCASTNRNSQCLLQCSGRTKPWWTLLSCLWHNLASRIWAPGSQVPGFRLQMMNTMHMSMGISGMKVLTFWNFGRWVLLFVNMHCTCIFIATIE